MRFGFFTPEQALEVEAMAAQIIPTDETPGAREARVINFIDRALTTFAKNNQAAYTQGHRRTAGADQADVPGSHEVLGADQPGSRFRC